MHFMGVYWALYEDDNKTCFFGVDCYYMLQRIVKVNAKTHQIAQIRHVEPQKRQYTTSEVGLHLFWALT